MIVSIAFSLPKPASLFGAIFLKITIDETNFASYCCVTELESWHLLIRDFRRRNPGSLQYFSTALEILLVKAFSMEHEERTFQWSMQHRGGDLIL